MTYSDFTLEIVERTFGLSVQPAALFPSLAPLPVPLWLQELLAKGRQLALISEKARSEFIVAPLLLASREISQGAVAIYSGMRLDVLPEQGLAGECDFVLTATLPVPVLHTPIVTILEAKKNDVEGGLGQCAAQMTGARLLNQKEGRDGAQVYGCVTTGEAWQFLRLDETELHLDTARYYIDNVGGILAVFQAIIRAFRPSANPLAGGPG
jgi:hypothetical protein